MKSFIYVTLIIFSLLLFGEANGQSVYWKTNGNNVGPIEFLGSTNNQDLRFRVNNAQQMRLVSNTGFLGIGSQYFTPSAMLHLNQLSYHNPFGNLIRTDGSEGLDLTWTMFSGTSVGNSTQKARFLLSPNTLTQNTSDSWDTDMINDAKNHLRIESSLGDVVFRAHGANSIHAGTGTLTERLRITSALYTDPHWGSNPVSTTRVSISGRPGNQITDPLAMLHIGDPGDYQQGGHRGWMNSGTYVQRSNDNVFFGLRARENSTNGDQNDAVIAWGDNVEPAERDDALRIVFCGIFNPGASPGEVHHLNGREAMRIHPLGNVGIGDFSINGLNQMPTQKLDIAGRLRVREVPLDTIPEVLIVGREIDSVGDYVLNHLPFPGDNSVFLSGTGEWLPGGSGSGNDCRWKDSNSLIPGELDMYMGANPSSNCYRGKLGVGIDAPKDAKMQVHNFWDRDQVRLALWAECRGDNDYNPDRITSITGYAHGTFFNPDADSRNTYIGVSGSGLDGGWTVGVLGIGAGSYYDINQYNIGVYASADTSSGIDIGLYAEGEEYAILTYGAVGTTGMPIILSDESVKTDIQNLSNASDILAQLQPKTYMMVNPEGHDLNFDDDLQYGFLAQDVEPILPNVVEDFNIPDVLDSTGFVENTHLNLKGIQYDEFIPLLVAGFQEQNATVTNQAAQISAQNDQIANMEAQLETQENQLQEMQNKMATMSESVRNMQAKTANCCNCPTKGTTGSIAPNGGKEMQLGQNIPNPFTNQTRIEFSLPESAAVILEITDEVGRPLERLIDAQMNEGRHSAVWDGSGFAPGVYFYTLYANGQLLTKKMIKK